MLAAWALAAAKPATSAVGGSLAALGSVVAIVLGAAALLFLGLLLARVSTRPKEKLPRKRTFAAGHRLATLAPVSSVAGAVRRLEVAGLGELIAATPSDHGVHVELRRRQNRPCEHVAGYLAGLFEGAWASDVQVIHTRCAGRDKRAACVFDVVPVGRVNGSASRTGAAPIPGSSDAPRRWPPARSGGG